MGGYFTFKDLEYPLVVNKVSKKCPTLSLNLLLKFNSYEMLPNDRNNCERFLQPQA